MTAATPTLIARAMVDVLATAVASLDVAVEREREAAVPSAELPRVLVYALDTVIDAEFAGAADLRAARFQVECLDAAADGDIPGDLADRVTELAETVRDALMADRTLGGACLGLFVEDGGEQRGQFSERITVPVAARIWTVSASFV